MPIHLSRSTSVISCLAAAGRVTTLLGGAFLLACSVQTAQAQTFYTNASSFSSAAAITQTIGFSGLVGTASYPNNNSGSYKTTSASGINVGGLQFVGSSNGFGNETYIETPSNSGGVYTLDGQDTLMGGRGSLIITGFSSQTAVSLLYGSSNTSGSISNPLLTIFTADGEQYSTTPTYSAGSSEFLGFVSANSAITEIEFTADDPSGSLVPYPTVVERISTGTGAAPEPATLALLLPLGIPLVMKYRRMQRAA